MTDTNDMNDTFHRPPGQNGPPELGILTWLFICIAGADPDIVIRKCREDIGKLRAMGMIAFGAFLYNSTMFGSIATHLAGHFDPTLIIGGIALAGYILTIDSYVFFRCAHLASGFEQLAQAGLQVSIPRKVSKMIHRSLGIRLVQSGCLGLVISIMTGLVIYGADIRARIDLNHLHDGASTARQLNEQADADIKRANDAVNLTSGNIAMLTKQINARLARGGNAAGSFQVQALESRKAGEEKRLVSQKAELSQLEAGRNERLRAGLANDPTTIQANTGVLAQINALEQIAGDDWKIAFVILLVDLIAMSLDLAPIFAKMNWLPTSYSVLMAREYLERMQKTVDDMVPPEPNDPTSSDDQLSGPPTDDDDPVGGAMAQPANDNEPPQPARRGRGRPRKYAAE